MAKRLFIYVPFDEDTDSDIKRGAQELEAALNKEGVSITTGSGHSIVRAELLFLGDEARASDIDEDDVLFVHGHGGSDDTATYDNSGGKIKIDVLKRKLNRMDNAGAFYFAICFSAKKNHIATAWGKNYEKVYGSDKVLEGGLIITTSRGTVRSCMLMPRDARLREV